MKYAVIPNLITSMAQAGSSCLKIKCTSTNQGVTQPRVVQVRRQNSFSYEIYKRTSGSKSSQNSWGKEKILKTQTLLSPSFGLELLADINILTHFIYWMLKLDSLQLLSFLCSLPLEYFNFQQAFTYLFLLFPASSAQEFFYRSNNIMYCGASAVPAVAPCVPYPK